MSVSKRTLSIVAIAIVSSLSAAVFLSGCQQRDRQLPSSSTLGEGPHPASFPDSTPLRRSSQVSKQELPDQLDVACEFSRPVAPYNEVEADGSTVTALMGNVSKTTYSVVLNDFLDLSKSTSQVFLSPLLNRCQLDSYSFDYVGPANEIISLGGRDGSGQTDCQNFITAVSKSGLQMRFLNVPLLNDPRKVIKTVIITISASNSDLAGR